MPGEGCEIYNSAKMTLEEVLDVMYAAEERDLVTVRLHTERSLSLQGRSGSRWMCWMREIAYDSCPGVQFFL